MKTVRQLLQVKGNHVCSVAPDTTVYSALKVMDDNNVGALLVLSQGRSRWHLLRARLRQKGCVAREVFEGYPR